LFCYEVGFVDCLIPYCLLPDEKAGLYQEEESLSHACTLVNVKTTCLVTNNEHHLPEMSSPLAGEEECQYCEC
jgi:hypothetical protein